MQNNCIYKRILRYFRLRRMTLFMRMLSVTSEMNILDVGGTHYNWHLVNYPAKITLLNSRIPSPLPGLPMNITYIQGDGKALPFPDNTFDIVFSNSVIEHLYTFENQKKFANEVHRVGKNLWMQTPARSFFFEPHFLTPFFHYLPKRFQEKLARRFTLWAWITHPTQEYAQNMVNEINLLTYRELQNLFPNCFIQKETFLGITKSFIAIRK